MVFLKRNQKVIALFGIVGLLISSAYVIQTPKVYEAGWQMQMAQFSKSNSSSSSDSNSEEPAALVQRLRSPTTYSIEVQQDCGIPENEESGEYLNKKLEVQTIKESRSAVQFKFRAPSPAQAKQCADAVVKMIKAQQRSLIEERFAGRQPQLAQYQLALVEEQQQLEKIKKSELGNFGYLAKLDKLSWLRTRIDALQEEALLSQMYPAKLIAPIYVPSKPVSGKARLQLLLGIVLGLMLGVLYAFGREAWRKAT